MNSPANLLVRAVASLLSVIVGLSLGLAVTALAGESPWIVLKVLWNGAFGSPYDLGMTLFYVTPLIFTGLSVATGLRAGLFNIGAEGQLHIAAMGSALAGIVLKSTGDVSALISIPVVALGGIVSAAFYAGIAGWMKAFKGSHEVITTIMLNFIAAGVTSWVAVGGFRNPDSQNPETDSIIASAVIPHFDYFEGAPVSAMLFVAVGTALVLTWVFRRTRFGFELQALGQNEEAAHTAGVRTRRLKLIAFLLAGALAAGAGVTEVMGNASRFRVGFSAEFGFVGIAVALLARNHPVGVIFSAVLFGALHKGATELDMETEHLTREIAWILQALVIFSVAMSGAWTRGVQAAIEQIQRKLGGRRE